MKLNIKKSSKEDFKKFFLQACETFNIPLEGDTISVLGRKGFYKPIDNEYNIIVNPNSERHFYTKTSMFLLKPLTTKIVITEKHCPDDRKMITVSNNENFLTIIKLKENEN